MSGEDFTIVLQGPLHENAVQHLGSYLATGARIVFSFWEGDDQTLLRRKLAELGLDPSVPVIRKRLRTTDTSTTIERVREGEAPTSGPVVLVESGPIRALDPAFARDPLMNLLNRVFQMVTTIGGLEEVSTPFAVKVRGDEWYADLGALFPRVRADPERMVVNNTFFFADRDRAFHPSDHLMLGRTDLLRGMFELAMQRIERGDTFGDEPLFALDHMKQRADTEFTRYLWRGGMTVEQLLCTSLFRLHGEQFDRAASKALILKHYGVVPVSSFTDYIWCLGTPKEAVAKFAAFLRTDPAYGRRYGVRPTAGDKRVEFIPFAEPYPAEEIRPFWSRVFGSNILAAASLGRGVVGIESMADL